MPEILINTYDFIVFHKRSETPSICIYIYVYVRCLSIFTPIIVCIVLDNGTQYTYLLLYDICFQLFLEFIQPFS